MVGAISAHIDLPLKEKLCVKIKDKIIFLNFKAKMYWIVLYQINVHSQKKSSLNIESRSDGFLVNHLSPETVKFIFASQGLWQRMQLIHYNQFECFWK